MTSELVSRRPATRWGEAFPIGNGHMGAMVYGCVEEERLDLSEQTFFSGDGKQALQNSNAAKAFEIMRRQTSENNYRLAKETAKQFIGTRGNYGTNLPVGTLFFQTGQDSQLCKTYERSLDLETGIVHTRYLYLGAQMERTCFMSHPDNLLVYRFKSQDKIQNLNIRFSSPRGETANYNVNGIDFRCQALETMHSDGTTGVSLYGQALILTDGKKFSQEECLSVSDASIVVVLLKMHTDFHGGLTQISFPEQNDSILEKRHCQDIKAHMERVHLEIQGSGSHVNQIPLLFQMGRYLLLSSSREDSALPAHLQGIWNDNVACRIGWTCDLHLDINTQMNYWPALVTALPETLQPLFRWIKDSLVVNGRKTAKEFYGRKGWAAELVSNAWGFTAPYWSEKLAPCPTGGVWVLTHMWEYVLFSGDQEFLQDPLFPILEEAVTFFDAYVFEDPDSGFYSCGPSISPENSFLVDRKPYQISNGCTYEILMIRELFSIYEQACEILGHKGTLLDSVRKKRKRLIPYRILEDGTLAEWEHPYPAADPQHRHTSHLLGVFPFGQITPEQTALAEAAEKTLQHKLNPESGWEDTGWARSLLILYEVRLKHSKKAWEHMIAMLKGLLEPNGMILHPPTRGAPSFDNVYELDGNTGLTSGIAEMLLQSHKGYLELLPCLPAEWESGRICGLVGRGGIHTDIRWDKTGCRAVLRADSEQQVTVLYGKEKKTAFLKPGQDAFLEFENQTEIKNNNNGGISS